LSIWENLLLGALALLVMFWMQPGIKQAMARSRQVPADWRGVMIPIALVVLLVIFLIAMV